MVSSSDAMRVGLKKVAETYKTLTFCEVPRLSAEDLFKMLAVSYLRGQNVSIRRFHPLLDIKTKAVFVLLLDCPSLKL